MPEHGIRSTYSQCPFELLMCDDEGILSSGTGFFFETNSELFLITNWHVVSGIDCFTRQRLDADGRFPTKLTAKLSSYVSETENNKFGIIPFPIPLYEPNRHEPVWLEHSRFGSLCDVIAIPVERPETCPHFMHNAANCINTIRIPVKPGCTVFIIGFPRAISVGFGLPIWKSGYIASEPHYDVTVGGEVREFGGLSGGINLPAFFIDSLTREGMSGSPVFANYIGNWNSTDPYEEIDPDAPDFFERDDIVLGHNAMEFVGCYSGRILDPELDGAALGLCWRKEVIAEICRNGIMGAYPHSRSTS